MLYKFKSRATADLILLEPHGRRLLQAMGKEPAPQGIVTVAQIPAAMAALEAAVAADDRRRAEAAQADEVDEANEAEPSDPAQDTVTLRQRAAPFLDMLRRSVADGQDVVWGV